jgi:hypothetical protein
MARKRFLPSAAATKQSRSYTVSGTWATGNTITFTINNVDLVVTIGANTTTTQVATTIYQAWQNTTLTDTTASAVPEVTGSGNSGGGRLLPQFAELTCTNPSAGVFTLKSTKAGVGVTVSVANTGSGSVSAGTLTDASGPSYADDADNFETNGLPASGDELVFESSNQALRDGLDFGASIQFATVYKYMSHTGDVGRHEVNRDNSGGLAYNEYRSVAPSSVHDGGVGSTTFHIEMGTGPGSGLFRWDATNGKAIWHVYGKPGRQRDGVPPTLLVGTHASNELHNKGGDVGVGFYNHEATTLLELNHGSGPQSQAVTYCGTACDLTTATIIVNGGTITTNSAICTSSGTATLVAGDWIHNAGDVEDLTIRGGTFRMMCGGTIDGTLTVSGGKFDHSGSGDALTFSGTIQLYKGGGIDDSNKTFAANTDIKLVECDLDEVDLKIGKNRTIRIIS